MRLFVAGLRKLVRRPATYVTFGLLVGLLALIYIAVGATARQQTSGNGARQALLLVTFPGAYTLLLSFILPVALPAPAFPGTRSCASRSCSPPECRCLTRSAVRS